MAPVVDELNPCKLCGKTKANHYLHKSRLFCWKAGFETYEPGRIPDEGSGIYAPAEDCHCKVYGHDQACALGMRCLCAYCSGGRVL